MAFPQTLQRLSPLEPVTTMTSSLTRWLPVLCSCTLLFACGGSDDAPAALPNRAGEEDASTPNTTPVDAGHRDVSSTSADVQIDPPTVDAGAEGGQPDAPQAQNCGATTCRGHGSCIGDEDTGSRCVCDDGYVQEAALGGVIDCVVDESCIKVKFLEDHCRIRLNAEPAVGLFFALDFCSGTAVLPDKLVELGIQIDVQEDGRSVDLNPESYSQIIPRGVESYVTIALDVSTSVTNDRDTLAQLTSEIRGFVQSLRPRPGEAPVGISIMVFARGVAEYVPFTTNLGDIDAALAALEADPSIMGSFVQPGGTTLYQAVNAGIRQTERIQRLREGVSSGGVLTSGTLVVITDGADSNSPTMDDTLRSLIESTLVNVISVGISNDIDDAALTAIGRESSFLAPTPADWSEAFSEIATRVDEYPDRAYLLAYCSAATTGRHTVTVGLGGTTVATSNTTSCEFNASVFSTLPSDVCDGNFFDHACDDLECGGITGCGACADSQCCAGGACVAPGPAPTCDTDRTCGPGRKCENGVCVQKQTVGDSCMDGDCFDGLECTGDVAAIGDAGATPGVCTERGDFGDECVAGTSASAVACVSLACARPNDIAPFTCQRPARMFDRCGGPDASAVCESGSACAPTGGLCAPLQLGSCSDTRDGRTPNSRCFSGVCQSEICRSAGACFYSWDSKLAR